MTESAGEPRTSPGLMLVIASLLGGGAERQLSDMANYWAAKGVNVTLATWSGPDVQDYYRLAPNISRLWLDTRVSSRLPFAIHLASVRRILQLRRVLQALRPDAVLSFMDISNVCTILAAVGLDVRVVVAERTHPAMNRVTSLPWRVLRRIFYSRADRVVAQTGHAAQWIALKCRARAVVIPNALRRLPQIARKRELLILGIGRLLYEKGFDILLQAFAQVAPRFPAWRLGIVGEGTERRALLQLREELNLIDRVEFTGEVREIENWMARASLVVHPSRREGFPNVVLEAMGMGVAVVCADCHSGISELIADGINGRLVPVGDVNALALVMAELMGAPGLREQLGREAGKVRQHYEQSTIMRQWDSCLFEGASPAVLASPET
ncbi:MAG TPA: glycosyltransferase family 4 protein [Steroidobacteraceae bacterium]|jgi:GalNAc-alpha-(1->4)-GalNAc-alpha-(1->3)-diNAcBac-PP-undecaprenol alpha-1,4-N-acetyl-D-galactosaminyltransferase|nr:glycosyltransferase family 4 protein [Steroidobacteraceae bacterium]